MMADSVYVTTLMTIRILLVDDQSAIRRGLRMSLGLENDLHVVGEAGDGLEALKLAGELKPDVVVMDVEMPKMDGLTAAEKLQTVAPGAAVVILSLHDSLAMRARARDAEIDFVAKHEGVSALVAAIRRAAKGLGPLARPA
jgi:DNA-binding NarL/FixJ family response regulator